MAKPDNELPVVIDERLLRAHLSRALDRRRKLEAEIQGINGTIEALQALRRDAMAMARHPNTPELDRIEPANLNQHRERLLPEVGAFGADLMGPRQAVMELLTEFPGLVVGRVVHELNGRIQSKSEDKRKVIYSTIYNLRNSGDLREDDNGRLFVTKGGG